jgi:hypothetical protein
MHPGTWIDQDMPFLYPFKQSLQVADRTLLIRLEL